MKKETGGLRRVGGEETESPTESVEKDDGRREEGYRDRKGRRIRDEDGVESSREKGRVSRTRSNRRFGEEKGKEESDRGGIQSPKIGWEEGGSRVVGFVV